MTVQTIDKRLAPESNMTPAASDKSQTAQSAEDAFMALLQKTSQRFGNQATGPGSPDKLLAEHTVNKQAAIRSDKAQTRKDDAKGDQGPAANPRAVAKAERPKAATPAKAQAAETKPAPAPAQDEASAPKVTQAEENAEPQAVDTDAQTASQDQTQEQSQQVQVLAVATEQKVVVEIDIEVTETVQVAETNPAAGLLKAAAERLGQAQQAGQTETHDPLANLSDEDRKRVLDLEKRIVSDLENGDAEDALEAATELVDQLIGKATQVQATDPNHHAMKAKNLDLLRQQADDLAAKLAGTQAQMSVQVQVNEQVSVTPVQVAAVVAESQIQLELPTQAVQAAAQTGPQHQRQAMTADASQMQSAMTAPTQEQTAEALSPFGAILAAQAESAVQKAAQGGNEAKPTASIAAVGAAQAAEKSSSTHSTQQTARTPRIPLQQQVMEQVSVQIDKAVKDGADTVKIQLKPYELGKIEIKLEMNEGRVTATVTAEKPETLALLQKDSKGLEKALEDAGLKPDVNATSFSLKGGEQQQNADRGQNNSNRKARGGRAGHDDGDDEALAAAAPTQARRAGGRSGVDISV